MPALIRLLWFAVLVTLAMSAMAGVSLWTGWKAATVQSARCQHLARQTDNYYSTIDLTSPDGCLLWGPLDRACETLADTEESFRLSEEGW